jgi:ligand-binding sensor domain-containing protein
MNCDRLFCVILTSFLELLFIIQPPATLAQSSPSATSHQFTPLSQYIHHSWQAEQGLPGNGVYALCQTRDGYVWLGTVEGLVRFDGVQWTVFNAANSAGLLHNWVSALAEDAEGGLVDRHNRRRREQVLQWHVHILQRFYALPKSHYSLHFP